MNASVFSQNWLLIGNNPSSTDYLGTNNAQPLQLMTTFTATPQPIKFFTGGSAPANERMRIDALGHIGIGITTIAANTNYIFIQATFS